ncbi:endothelin-converting enzyme 1-like [Leptopilina heterotoma]|uniref:endothelin-converting enzyme 1-like n=1 Tax=Leptopilina heterotoma TaxID=63436 RepID=UPI001CA9D6DA|nr:endothelin-converting enzyme 1-like [Leptopilina heterotoma]
MIWLKVCFTLLAFLHALPRTQSEVNFDLRPIIFFLKSGLDHQKKSCENFYDKVCGKWFKADPKLDNKIFSPFTITDRTINILIEDILENRLFFREENKKVSMEKEWFATCMNTNYSRKEGLKLFRQIVEENSHSTWQNVAEYYAMKIGEISLFHINMNADNVLQILAPRKLVTDIITDVKNHKLFLLFFQYLGREFDKNIEMEVLKLIKSISELVNVQNANIVTTTIQDLTILYRKICPFKTLKINWFKLFGKLAKESGVKFTKSDKIQVDVNYLFELCKILNITPASAIVNYLHFNFIMSKEAYDTVLLIINKMTRNERAVHCIRSMQIKQGFQDIIIKNYSYIPYETDEMIYDMFENIKNELLIEIENSWLQNDAKITARQKVVNMNYKYVISTLPNENVNGAISYNFEIGSVGLQNLINFKKAQMIMKIQTYKNCYMKKIRSKRQINTNMCYKFQKNIINIGLGMLFPPLFQPKAPIAYNYGRIGFILGHEMSHAFDFKKLEKYFPDSFYNSSLYERQKNKMLKKRNCFISQFNRFNVNGIYTLNENVADTQGFKLAFNALQRIISKKNSEYDKKLPGLENLSAQKLFFLAFGNLKCSNPMLTTINDVHSSNYWRLIGTLQNSEEFSKIFHCQKGEFMNPWKKCDLWKK